MFLCFAAFLAAVLACLLAGHSILFAILLGMVLFCGLGLRRGFSLRELGSMAWKKGREALIVAAVLLSIGVLSALWRTSGTIAWFLYHGLQLISPNTFLLVVFLLCAVLSMLLGTAFGVTGTAGVVLITLARASGVDLGMTAGAIVSGAFFGDRMSPVSSSAALVAACTQTELYSNVKQMAKTGALPTVLTAGSFLLLSLRHPLSAVDPSVLELLSGSFELRWPALVTALLMLVLALCRLPIVWAILTSAVSALAVSVWMQGVSLPEALRAAVLGFAPQGALADILSGGGLVSMLSSTLLIFSTCLYAGVLEGIRALAPIEHQVERLSGGIGRFPAAMVLSLGIDAVFCNQGVTILMDEQLLAESYRRDGASRQELAMDIENSGVVMAALIPWSVALSVPMAMLEIDSLKGLPWCVLLYLLPLCYLATKRWFYPQKERCHAV